MASRFAAESARDMSQHAGMKIVANDQGSGRPINALQNNAQYPMRHTKYRADIDGLRAIAVLSVVIFHAFPSLLPGGFIGVDIFFVISGFLISSILLSDLQSGRFDVLSFYARRIRRIFPALVSVLIATFVTSWFVLLPDEFQQLGKHLLGSVSFLSNFVLWRESGYFDSASEAKLLLHLWSLGIEEQFYIFFPFVLWAGWRLRLNILVLILLLLSISFGINVWTLRYDAIAAFYSPLARFWELLLGAALAYFSLHGMHETIADDGSAPVSANLRAAAGMILLCLGFLLINSGRAFPGWWAILPTFGAGLVISAGPSGFISRRLLSHRWLVWFGLISFPLYLWHWPLLALLRVSSGESPGRAARLAAIILAVGLSWLTYRLIERPIRFGGHAAQKITVLLIAVVAMGALGWHCFINGGYSFRVPADVKAINEYAFDYQSVYRDGRCFLRQDQRYEAFRACEPYDVEALKKPYILLWGDSHAAHLYPGLQQRFGQRFAVIQRTVSSCPPLIDVETPGIPYCREINGQVLSGAALHKPARVILAARWGSHDWRRLEATIKKLHALGIREIDLIGPVPKWKGTLPKQLAVYMRTNRGAGLPKRMSDGVDFSYRDIEPQLEAFAMKTGVRYISPGSFMCDVEGCLVRTGNSVQTLTAWDYDHLTSDGSRFLVSQFPEN